MQALESKFESKFDQIQTQLSQLLAAQSQAQQEKGRFPTQGTNASAHYAGNTQYPNAAGSPYASGSQYSHPPGSNVEELKSISTFWSERELTETFSPMQESAPPMEAVMSPRVNPVVQVSTSSTHYVGNTQYPSTPGGPYEEAKAVTTRSGRVLEQPVAPKAKPAPPPESVITMSASPDRGVEKEVEVKSERGAPVVVDPKVPLSPAPSAVKSNATTNAQFLHLLKRVQLPLLLLEAMETIPDCTTVLKDLLAKRHTESRGEHQVEQVSSILETNIPEKRKDPGSPTITIDISGQKFSNALLDLGASINVLPYSAFKKLDLGTLKATPVTIQLADRSIRVPKGVVEDVLVRVGEFQYLVDFIVLDICPGLEVFDKTPIILGRPFLATSNAIMDCNTGKVQLSAGAKKIEVGVFNIDTLGRIDEQVRQVNFIDTPSDGHSDLTILEESLGEALGAGSEHLLNTPVAFLGYDTGRVQLSTGTKKLEVGFHGTKTLEETEVKVPKPDLFGTPVFHGKGPPGFSNFADFSNSSEFDGNPGMDDLLKLLIERSGLEWDPDPPDPLF